MQSGRIIRGEPVVPLESAQQTKAESSSPSAANTVLMKALADAAKVKVEVNFGANWWLKTGASAEAYLSLVETSKLGDRLADLLKDLHTDASDLSGRVRIAPEAAVFFQRESTKLGLGLDFSDLNGFKMHVAGLPAGPEAERMLAVRQKGLIEVFGVPDEMPEAVRRQFPDFLAASGHASNR